MISRLVKIHIPARICRDTDGDALSSLIDYAMGLPRNRSTWWEIIRDHKDTGFHIACTELQLGRFIALFDEDIELSIKDLEVVFVNQYSKADAIASDINRDRPDGMPELLVEHVVQVVMRTNAVIFDTDDTTFVVADFDGGEA